MIEQRFDLIALIPLFPLLGAAYCFAMRGKKPSLLCAVAACVMVALSLLTTISSALPLFALAGASSEKAKIALTAELYDWISVPGLSIGADLMFDQLTLIMLFVITFVGLLIHIYSIGYMFHDPDFNRFFAYLNLFVFFMIVLVTAKNVPVMFVGWEGVGLCSYLLISFWWTDIEKAKAGKKAFITNRVGDFAFLTGALILYRLFADNGLPANFDFTIMPEIIGGIKNFPFLGAAVLDVAAILLFIGATGKSAQIPLYVWLPDAMAGPTPVSALIHAATMVTAGVYMTARMSFLFTASPFAMGVIAATGCLTALFAALIAMAQTDIKKVLAYSTVSQLGLMFTAAGVGAYGAAIFHLATHAFFKSLLFLGAGSVIHSMNGEQDIIKMGGLREKIPHTFRTFFVGTYAIAGLPLMAGFFSKDEILLNSLFGSGGHAFFFAVASLASLLTAIYMHRLLFLVFFGSFRGDAKAASHIHESPAVMTAPLYILAFFSAFSGFIALSKKYSFGALLAGVVTRPAARPEIAHSSELAVMGCALVLAFAGVATAWKFYMSGTKLLEKFSRAASPLIKLQLNKFYVDEAYDLLIIQPLYAFSKILHRLFDAAVIDSGFVNGAGYALAEFNRMITKVQNGDLRRYVSAMALGAAAFLLYVLIYSR